MFKLIIIDDEPIILKQLSALYRWEDCGFSLEASFSNAKAALEYIESHHVDLVITDIKMPGISGLEIADICLRTHPDTYFIFISAYRDFEYVQKAIKYNTVDYITKPFIISDFEQAVKKAYEKLSAIKPDSGITQHQSLKQQIFSHIIGHSSSNRATLENEMTRLGLDSGILNNNCAVISLKLSNLQSFIDNYWKYGLERLYNAIVFLFSSDSSLFCSIINHSFDVSELICIDTENSADFQNKLNRHINNFKNNLTSVMHLECEYAEVTFFDSIDNISILNFNSKSLIEKAKEYINEHYGENISLKDVASHVALSPVYFSAFFKQHSNETFSNYLKNVRLKKALGLLKNTELSINAICTAVGYKNMTYFYNIVKEETNMTPNEYRAFVKKKEIPDA